ncbi:hypothetical protein PHISCL_11305 [Aspergillus sclerotialis]|uniref:Uncharacterized protein n=1 Tax=Aspergillus sclerotialis TaxID=2070753 RepID=A0A3A2YZM8_9EURO|nr:hypothetical protein PHISCL_11305 [Aspergillus sclerotialis]
MTTPSRLETIAGVHVAAQHAVRRLLHRLMIPLGLFMWGVRDPASVAEARKRAERWRSSRS